MIKNIDIQQCCGCTACANICSQGAIKMETDSMGFSYPKFDFDKCVQCGLCEKVCPFRPFAITRKPEDIKCYIAYNKDSDIVMASRSGGVFYALCNYVISQRGVVYGVGFTSDFLAMHKRADSLEKCEEFRGSKYVQSDKAGIFLSVLRDLKKGTLVLFSGTACEIAGLKSFLLHRRVDCSKLLLVDIVCHGVPSPRIWKECLDAIEKKKKKKIKKVDFRDKKGWGWGEHKERIDWTDDTYTYTYTYTYMFYAHLIMRPSCGVCHFANVQRPGDITLADGWGWKNIAPNLNAHDRGCSLVIPNTETGEQVFSVLKEQLNYVETTLNNMMQPNLKSPTVLNPQSNDFQKEYMKFGFNYVKCKYIKKLSLREYLRWYLRCVIRKMKGGVK